jgi:hypothetical protein
MPRTNLHELANRLLECLSEEAADGRFQGRLREVAGRAGLNSVRSAEAVRVLEEAGRIEVVQRGRRGRDTIITIRSNEPMTIEDAEQMRPKQTRRARLNYEDIGRSVVDRLLELSRNDGLRSAQVDAFAAQSRAHEMRMGELQESLDAALEREADLRVRLRAAEEALERAEENLKRVFAGRQGEGGGSTPVDDDDAKAVLDILRSTR